MLKVRIFADMRKQQKNAGQPLLAGIEEMIHQILFDSKAMRKHVGCEQFSELRLFVEQTYHTFLFNSNDRREFNCSGGGQAKRHSRQTLFTQKAILLHYREYGLLALLGDKRELDLTVQYVKDGIRRIALRKDRLFFLYSRTVFLSTIFAIRVLKPRREGAVGFSVIGNSPQEFQDLTVAAHDPRKQDGLAPCSGERLAAAYPQRLTDVL